ncbi:MAG: hypothetical protein ACLQIB_52900, partial [Isosphaeraceae bacterium]
MGGFFAALRLWVRLISSARLVGLIAACCAGEFDHRDRILPLIAEEKQAHTRAEEIIRKFSSLKKIDPSSLSSFPSVQCLFARGRSGLA